MLAAEAGAGPYKARPSARSRALRAGVLALAFLASAMTPALSAQGDTERVSVATDGAGPDGASLDPAISADGRYVAFNSSASDLVAGDTNSLTDVFVRDRQTGTTERVSLDTSGGDPNATSLSPTISADGRYVAFASVASDLVGGDANSVSDVFVHDRQAGTTQRVSFDTDGADADGADPDNSSSGAAISADGRYVAFHSAASDLVAGDANSLADVFVHDFLGPPELLFAPPSHAFGARDLAAGPTEPFTLTVSNIGGGTMNIASIGLGGVDAGQFAIASHTCAAPLIGGESCDINVAFDPSSAGALTASVDVVSSGGDGRSALSGQGTTETPPPTSTGSDPGSGPGPNPQPAPGPALQPGPQPRCAGKVATVVASGKGTVEGTAGRDVIVGTSGGDVIRGRGGRDLICGRGGDDRLLGGSGGDDLHGNAGSDRLAGNGAGDTLYGHSGADVLSGDGAGDELHGGGGRDRLAGGAGSDKLRGEGGDDRCDGGRGSDSQRGC